MKIGSFDNCPGGLPQALERAAQRGGESGITLLDNRGRLESSRDFATLHRAAQQGAGRWQALGIGVGDPILVCLPTSWDFLDAWLGAVLAGALPVSIAPPGALGSPALQVGKALKVCQSVGAKWLIAPEAFLEEANRGLSCGEFDPIETRMISATDWGKITPDKTTGREPEPEETAFLQLTSGSTGSPRAVEISHRALVHNALAIRDSVSRTYNRPADYVVSWLPLYHDMGLIGCLSNSITNGTALDLLSPRSFLARPWVWLEAIARRSRVMAPAPNFAFQMCVDRVSSARAKSLDLSSYHHIFCGSEMVRPETAHAFLDHFKEAGIEPRHFRPCYGLAESTLGVTVESRGAGLRTHSVPGIEAATVSLGETFTDNEISILPPESSGIDLAESLPEEVIGRVIIRSPALMSGYYQDPEATREVLQNGWLDTGDLGFLYDRELYLTGRSKEILILNGTNIMPHEIEWVAEGVSPAGGSERCGAFSVLTEQGEQPVLVIETTEKRTEAIDRLKHDVASAIGKELSLPLADLVPVRRGSIPRTSSGKVQRRSLQALYHDGQLDRLDRA